MDQNKEFGSSCVTINCIDAGWCSFKFTVKYCTWRSDYEVLCEEEWHYYHMVLSFTDNIDLISIDRRAVEKTFAPLKTETATIKSIKTKCMITGRNRGRPCWYSAETVRGCLELLKNVCFLEHSWTMPFPVEWNGVLQLRKGPILNFVTNFGPVPCKRKRTSRCIKRWSLKNPSAVTRCGR